MRTALTLLLAASLLAGCFSAKTDDTSTTSQVTGPRTVSTTTTAAPTPPHAVLLAAKTNGTAPLNVTFTVDAAPRGNATWTLAFGDGNQTTGATLPSNVTHAYAAAGNLTARLTVRFAGGATANATLTLNITSTLATSQARLHATGEVTATVQGPGAPTPFACGIQGEGKDLFTYDWPFNGTATNVQIDLAIGGDGNDFDLYFFGPDGKEIDSSVNLNAIDVPTESITQKGPFPPGVYQVQVQGCVVVNGDFTLDAVATIAG